MGKSFSMGNVKVLTLAEGLTSPQGRASPCGQYHPAQWEGETSIPEPSQPSSACLAASPRQPSPSCPASVGTSPQAPETGDARPHKHQSSQHILQPQWQTNGTRAACLGLTCPASPAAPTTQPRGSRVLPAPPSVTQCPPAARAHSPAPLPPAQHQPGSAATAPQGAGQHWGGMLEPGTGPGRQSRGQGDASAQLGAPGTCPSGQGRGRCQAAIREIAARLDTTGLTGWETARKRQPGPCVTAWSHHSGARHQEGLWAAPQPPAHTRACQPTVTSTPLHTRNCYWGHLRVCMCGAGGWTHALTPRAPCSAPLCLHTHATRMHTPVIPSAMLPPPGAVRMPPHMSHTGQACTGLPTHVPPNPLRMCQCPPCSYAPHDCPL